MRKRIESIQSNNDIIYYEEAPMALQIVIGAYAAVYMITVAMLNIYYWGKNGSFLILSFSLIFCSIMGLMVWLVFRKRIIIYPDRIERIRMKRKIIRLADVNKLRVDGRSIILYSNQSSFYLIPERDKWTYTINELMRIVVSHNPGINIDGDEDEVDELLACLGKPGNGIFAKKESSGVETAQNDKSTPSVREILKHNYNENVESDLRQTPIDISYIDQTVTLRGTSSGRITGLLLTFIVVVLGTYFRFRYEAPALVIFAITFGGLALLWQLYLWVWRRTILYQDRVFDRDLVKVTFNFQDINLLIFSENCFTIQTLNNELEIKMNTWEKKAFIVEFLRRIKGYNPNIEMKGNRALIERYTGMI